MHLLFVVLVLKKPSKYGSVTVFKIKGPSTLVSNFPSKFCDFFFKKTYFTDEKCVLYLVALPSDMERHCCLAQSKLLGPYLWLRSDSQESWGWGSYSQLLPTLETGQPSPSILLVFLLKRLIWGMLCLPCSVMPRGLGFQPLFICLIVAMEIQYLKR